ncbi:MAG TPA: ATP-binding protein [Prevotella sp.]|nr:ATP-binding protein [uncultured Prevotella sp.]HBF05695.1 ATP-binding protein [Candidatus Segatella violae]
MQKEVFKTLIKEGQDEIQEIELYQRPFDFEEQGRYVLVGIRQAGKSYLLYQRAKQFLANGHDIKEIVYLNFDDERLYGMQVEDFDLILQAYNAMYSYKPILFFDEIQNIEGWEHFARRLANQKYMVFITGSNAKMLSRDIATTLGARYFDEKIFPYSFQEYLEAQGIILEKNWQYGKQKDIVQQNFAEYFKWGGFPELLLYKNKRHWLNGLYEKIVLGDVIQRNGIKNEQALRLAIKRLAENIMQPTAYNRLANMVKSTGVKTNSVSIIDYIRYIKEACLMFTLDNYASKFAEKETAKKHYFTDNGLLSIFLTESKSPLLENLCAITLHKKYNKDSEMPKLYYYNRNIEVDFFVPEESLAIQASYSLTDLGTRKREVDALLALNKKHPLQKARIITYDEEETIQEGGQTIEVIPIWKWLADFF